MKLVQNNNLKAKAIYFLSKRDHAYLELFNKLKKYSSDEVYINNVLHELVAKGYLSEERFIENYLSSKIKKYGVLRIRQVLNKKTGNLELVNKILQTSVIDEVVIAKKIFRKKFDKVSVDVLQKAKQVRFLTNKGFSYSTIRKVFDDIKKGSSDELPF